VVFLASFFQYEKLSFSSLPLLSLKILVSKPPLTTSGILGRLEKLLKVFLLFCVQILAVDLGCVAFP